MAGWVVLVALTLFPQNCLLSPSAREGVRAAPRDVVLVFASELRHGDRVTLGLMDNQKLKGVFLGIEEGRVLVRLDRDDSGKTLPLPAPSIHSLKVRNGGSVIRP